MFSASNSNVVVPVRGSTGGSSHNSWDHVTGSGAGGFVNPRKGDVETWILQEYCNAGTLLDAVLAGTSRGFFVGEVPQMVSAHFAGGDWGGMAGGRWVGGWVGIAGDWNCSRAGEGGPDGRATGDGGREMQGRGGVRGQKCWGRIAIEYVGHNGGGDAGVGCVCRAAFYDSL